MKFLILLLALTGCGGGSGSSPASPPAPAHPAPVPATAAPTSTATAAAPTLATLQAIFAQVTPCASVAKQPPALQQYLAEPFLHISTLTNCTNYTVTTSDGADTLVSVCAGMVKEIDVSPTKALFTCPAS